MTAPPTTPRLPPDDDPRALAALLRRVFPTATPAAIERVAEGVSTRVYRIRRDPHTFYLRVLPEADATFAPEVRVHALLRQRGVRAPEVVYYAPHDDRLARSVMITAEIPGHPLSQRPVDQATPSILHEAGRQLAIINSIPVHGFGWIRRDRPHVTNLEAEHPSHRAFATEQLEPDLAALHDTLLTPSECAAIQATLARHAAWLDGDHAWLAHGDFDLTHIFAHDGRYSGIIDFGEIRGADRWYDLALFSVFNGDPAPIPPLASLLAGYQSVTPLSPDHQQRIAFAALLIAVRTLARTLAKYPRWAPRHPALPSIRHTLTLLPG